MSEEDKPDTQSNGTQSNTTQHTQMYGYLVNPNGEVRPTTDANGAPTQTYGYGYGSHSTTPQVAQNYGQQPYSGFGNTPYGNSFGNGNYGGYGNGGFGGNGNYGGYGNGGYNGMPPYGTPGAPKHPKRKWSTAFLSISAALSLLVGGVVGAGITSIALNGGSSASSSEGSSQGESQTIPGWSDGSGSSGSSNGDSSGGTYQIPGGTTQGQSTIEQGTQVDSAPGLVIINSSLINGTSAGTGFVIDADKGIVLTNYHVVEDTETVVVTVADSGTQYEATVLGHDASRDIAVLQISGASDLTAVTIADGTVSVGDSITMMGNSEGQGYISELEGKVTGTDQTITARDSASSSSGEVLNNLIETDADVVSGYSGGVMLNSDGEVVGITVAASSGTTSDTVYGYAIPIETGVQVADQVLTGESSGTVVVGRSAALGIQVTDSASSAGATGATVSNVISGSAAEAAGLQAGDIITAVNGEAISSASALSEKIQTFSVGDTVTLTIVRGTQTTDLTVTLKESSFN